MWVGEQIEKDGEKDECRLKIKGRTAPQLMRFVSFARPHIDSTIQGFLSIVDGSV